MQSMDYHLLPMALHARVNDLPVVFQLLYHKQPYKNSKKQMANTYLIQLIHGHVYDWNQG